MTPIQDVMSKEGIDRKMPPGVLVEGHVVEAKLRDSYISLGIVIPGSIAALVWAFTRGIGWVEIWVFAGTFALSTVGIGMMHRYFVHRSFRCGPLGGKGCGRCRELGGLAQFSVPNRAAAHAAHLPAVRLQPCRLDIVGCSAGRADDQHRRIWSKAAIRRR